MNRRAHNFDETPSRQQRFSMLALSLGVGLCICLPACQPEDTAAKNPIVPTVAPTPPPRDLLIFPSEMHVEDQTVNQFVIEAMHTCVTGEYDAFRLLWSAREEPMARGEFDKGWKAIEEIRILALEKVRLAPKKDQISQTPELVYALYANVRLNPDLISPQQKLERDAISMIVHEQGKWRMAKAPKKMRHWLKKLVAPINNETTTPPAAKIQTTPIPHSSNIPD